MLRIHGSMTFWGGSGSADPCLWLMDPDPDLDPGSWSCYFRHWPLRCQQKNNFLTQFFRLLRYFLKLHLHHFSKIKSQKESQNSRNQGFSYYFCMMMEGSGSGRPKNMWIRWIRIRIRNTGEDLTSFNHRTQICVHFFGTLWQCCRSGIRPRKKSESGSQSGSGPDLAK